MLASLGWTPALEDQFAPHAADGLEPARVAVEHRGAYVLYTARGECPAELSGRLRHGADERGDLPAVGDWVAVTPTDPALVQAVLPRRTKFSRHGGDRPRPDDRAGRRRERRRRLPDRGARRRPEHPPARALPDARLGERGRAGRRADEGGSLRRRRRPRSTRSSRSRSACLSTPSRTSPARASTRSRPYFAEGPDGRRARLVRRRQVVARQPACRRGADGDRRAPRGRQGRHTTTNRQLLLLPGGGLFLDTPGMREIRLWDSEEGLADRVRRRRRRRRRSAGSTTARTRPSRTAASVRRSPTGRSTRSATSAGGSSRASCSTWR